MAFSSLFTLLDDIAAVLDDVSVMTKAAAKKTVGVLSDDLALNANQVSGKNITPQRELPIVRAVAKGSLVNKAILIPLALLLSILLPSAISWLLLIGGGYLCFEGAEKLLHKFPHKNEPDLSTEAETPPTASESDKIKGAIRTDFILSAEIIIIALGTLQETDTLTKVLSLCVLGAGITFFVYGLVGLIVKLDDIGFWMLQKKSAVSQKIGQFLLFIMPWFMKSLSVIGTIAMFLVGGGIFVHYLPPIHHFVEKLNIPDSFGFLADFGVGLVLGLVLCAVLLPLMKLFDKQAH